MRFRNPHPHPIGPFHAGADVFTVDPGAEVEIPDRVAFVVPRRGLALVCLEAARLDELLKPSPSAALRKEEEAAEAELPIAEGEDGDGVVAGEDEEIESEQVSEPEAAAAVEAMLRQLQEQGVVIPGAKARSRRGRRSAKE